MDYMQNTILKLGSGNEERGNIEVKDTARGRTRFCTGLMLIPLLEPSLRKIIQKL